jgi:putative resolvase
LERQKKVLEMYCASHGWKFELITDLGSGMNYYKKGLKKLLNAILEGDVGRWVFTHKDRLLRFGAELIFALCEAREVEVIIINSGTEIKFEEELAKNFGNYYSIFSKLYRSRSRKNQKLLEGIKQAVDNVTSA